MEFSEEQVQNVIFCISRCFFMPTAFEISCSAPGTYYICMMSEDHALRSNARVYVTSTPHVNSRVRSRATVQHNSPLRREDKPEIEVGNILRYAPSRAESRRSGTIANIIAWLVQ